MEDKNMFTDVVVGEEYMKEMKEAREQDMTDDIILYHKNKLMFFKKKYYFHIAKSQNMLAECQLCESIILEAKILT